MPLDAEPAESPAGVVETRLRRALSTAFGPEHGDVDPLVRPSQFADLQANVALSLSKRVGLPPREVADRLVAALDVEDVTLPPQVTGPGFVNFSFRPEWLAQRVNRMGADPRLGVPLQERQVVPIDYSAPNVAKEMHVGHLRTTVVGDALARTLEHLGHAVVRQNHIGDWGTPFGMLIEHLLDVGEESDEAHWLVTEPNAFYQAARGKFDTDDGFAERSRRRVVALQGGDPETLRLWGELIELSKTYFNRIYSFLDVSLTDADLAGESTYNAVLPEICDELEAAGIAVVSDGALCVFLDEHTGREGKPVPLIVRKSDGGFGYATTDLATIKHRVQTLGSDRILYVVGAPQALHLQMVFATARKAGWLPPDVEAVHVQIGNVLGADGKLLRTRSGAPVRLWELLQEGVERAAAVLAESRQDLSAEARAEIARHVGIGAVKYADLSVSHSAEYTFDFDRMLSLHGNTGPYLQYAAARIRSLLRKGDTPPSPVIIAEEAERVLALSLLGFGDVLSQVGETLEPHRLCGYLFEVAQAFTSFYETCPVLRAKDPSVRASRLTLCTITLDVLDSGLGLLGITAPEHM